MANSKLLIPFHQFVSKRALKLQSNQKLYGLAPSAVYSDKGEGNSKFWRKVSLYVALPVIGFCAFGCFLQAKGEKTMEVEREPFVKYEYLRRRNKPFPWGDGNHTLFHNPRKNPLPDGYEDEVNP